MQLKSCYDVPDGRCDIGLNENGGVIISESIKRLIVAFRTDIPRWVTIVFGIVYAVVTSSALIVSYSRSADATLKGLLLMIVVAASWTLLWTVAVKFMDTMKSRMLGFLLLIVFGVLVLGNNLHDVSRALTPVETWLSRGDLPTFVNLVSIVAIGASVTTSVLRPARLREVYCRLRTTGQRHWFTYLTVLSGILWAADEELAIFDDAVLGPASFFADNIYGFFSSAEAFYWMNHIHGVYILYLEAAALTLMILYADRMQVRRSLRTLALLGCCAAIIIFYLVSFDVALSDFGPFFRSLPGPLMLLVMAFVAIFRGRETRADAHLETEYEMSTGFDE